MKLQGIGLAALVLAHHPADVGEPEAAADGIGVLVLVIHVQVVGAMTAGPDEDAVLERHRSSDPGVLVRAL